MPALDSTEKYQTRALKFAFRSKHKTSADPFVNNVKAILGLPFIQMTNSILRVTQNIAEKTKILIIDDEPDMLDLIAECLADDNFELKSISSAINILSDIETFKPDLILTDKLMPHTSGHEVITQIRQSPKYFSTPILVLTGLISEKDKIESLDIGADDYITKPFSPAELKARVRAHARRSKREARQSEATKKMGLFIDPQTQKATLFDEELSLTLTEFKILSLLYINLNKIVSRDLLLKEAFSSSVVTGRNVDVHIVSLRRKLGNCGKDLISVRGVGYKLSS
jgi:DNA-binding response OmpR family regulator